MTDNSLTITASPSGAINSGETVQLTASGGEHYAWSTGEAGPTITVNPLYTSTYSVTGTSETSSQTIHFTVPVRTVSIILVNEFPKKTPAGSKFRVLFDLSISNGSGSSNVFVNTDGVDHLVGAFSSGTHGISIASPDTPGQYSVYLKAIDTGFPDTFGVTDSQNFLVSKDEVNIFETLPQNGVPSTSSQTSSGVVLFVYTGSLFKFSLSLPPALTSLLLSTDTHTILVNKICNFAATQKCQQFLAGLVVTGQEGLFLSESKILQGEQVVRLKCSDQALYLDDIAHQFSLNITPIAADNVTLNYVDSLQSFSIILLRSSSQFLLNTSDRHFAWIGPCDSDVPRTSLDIFEHPLLEVTAQDASVTSVEMIQCATVCRSSTSDLKYVCHLKQCAEKLGRYLDKHFANYTDHLSDRCHVVYNGPVRADLVNVDLDNCRMIFHGFSVPLCSDTVYC